ncbi:branched-chain amino acid ABC transporter permease [Ferrovibrio xuzhouensis]|uniref:Branched-chain amino acid ABC transporter permease n=1 Tax=Ferrovibrio xuzhouensis TaxID=1576914 RepID=A0ABV7VKG0_9PROT
MFDVTLQFIVNGLVAGCFYALTAVGLTLIFGMMQIVNFAHGEFFVLGGMLAYVLTHFLGIPFAAAIPIVLVVMWIFGAFVDWALLSRMRDAPMISTALVTIGLSVFMMNTMLLVFGTEPKNIETGIGAAPLIIGTIVITKVRVITIFVSVAAIVAVHYLINHTRRGRAMRAVFQQKEAAALVGIPISQTYRFTFALGTTLAALSGILLGAVFVVHPTAAELATLKAFVVVILGGMGSFGGAIVGGLLLGVVESLWGGFISTGYMDVVGFLLVIGLLLVKPSGLFGMVGAREK